MLNEKIKASGHVVFELRDEMGNLKEKFEYPNLVVTTGLAFIASRVKENTATPMSHMALGTTSTAAATGDTALGAEVGRVALSSANITTTTVANDSITYVATFGPGVATGAIVEAGMFNNVSAGTMMCRTVFAVVNKGALDTLTITWKVTMS